MKRIDFENGTLTGNIIGTALPMLVAQILNLLYNIVDRIYIGRIPEIGTTALGAVGLCFPFIVIISAFSGLFGTGGAPLFSIYRGRKDQAGARKIMNTSFTMLFLSGVILMTIGLIFALGFGVRGAAIATIISQFLSALFVIVFLTRKSELKVRFLRKAEVPSCIKYAKNITSLGTAAFIMQVTNSLVTICCNNVLAVTGGDIYISVMTIVSSVRQLVETPIHAVNEGASPVISYNYGAKRTGRVRKAILIMSVITLGYTAIMWSIIILAPHMLLMVFTLKTGS